MWKFSVPQPKSSVVSPLCMANVGTSSSMSFSSSSLSIAPTMKFRTPQFRTFLTQFLTKSW